MIVLRTLNLKIHKQSVIHDNLANQTIPKQ